MNKIKYLKGNWIVKKTIDKNTSIKGRCFIKNISRYYYELKEDVETKINNQLISGHQLFKIFELRNDLIFYFNTGQLKNNQLYKFEKKKICRSLFFCKKDLYIANFRIISNNFFTIYTKIKGPKKNLSIFAKYYRTI